MLFDWTLVSLREICGVEEEKEKYLKACQKQLLAGHRLESHWLRCGEKLQKKMN